MSRIYSILHHLSLLLSSLLLCRLSLMGNMQISFNEIAEMWKDRGEIDDVCNSYLID